MAHVFISYSKKNRDYARALADDLLARGFDVWIDDRIDFGSRWVREIFSAIDACAAFIVIMTPESYESDWVEKEYLYADRRKKPPFPLLRDGEVFPFYVPIQFFLVSDGKLPNATFYEDLAKVVPPNPISGQDVASIPQQRAEQRAQQPKRRTLLWAGLLGLIFIAVLIGARVAIQNYELTLTATYFTRPPMRTPLPLGNFTATPTTDSSPTPLSPSATATPILSTATQTQLPSWTPTPVPPTATLTDTPTLAPTLTRTFTATATLTPTTVPTNTLSPTPTSTASMTLTRTATSSSTPTLPPSPTATATFAGTRQILGVITNTQASNVRSGPGTSYPIVTALSPGERVTVLEMIDGDTWVHIRLNNGSEGYIYRTLISTATPTLDPSITPPTPTRTPVPPTPLPREQWMQNGTVTANTCDPASVAYTGSSIFFLTFSADRATVIYRPNWQDRNYTLSRVNENVYQGVDNQLTITITFTSSRRASISWVQVYGDPNNGGCSYTIAYDGTALR